jgi:beta-lactamase class D
MRKKRVWFITVLLILTIPAAAIEIPTDLTKTAAPFFKDSEGALVIYDLKANTYGRYNKARCTRRFSPMSTFKIPNSLIALETGVLKDVEEIIPWDKKRDPAKEWWVKFGWAKDHTLRSAIKHSVVWFYREVARRVGRSRMQKMVDAFDYGNKDISGPIDLFWLNGTIKISADEQVEFLKRFYLGKLKVSKPSLLQVKDILVREKTEAYTFSAKTGGGAVKNGKAIGWYVGYVERGKDVYFFTINIDGPSYASVSGKRKKILRQVLKALSVI